MKPRPPHAATPAGPLTVMCAGLVLAALPLAELVTPFSFGFLLAAVAARLALDLRRMALPGLPLKLALLAFGVGGVVVSTGTLVGLEATLSIVLILAGLKLLEANSVPGIQVLALLGWFLGLCGLFFGQYLMRWLYVGAVCALVGGALVAVHRGSGTGGIWRSARLMVVMGLQALPIVILLFIFFPRTYGGFRFTFGRPLHDGSGMSDRLEPGTVASLAMNEAIAFRVDFPDGAVPAQSQLYWRGAVLWRGDGFNWMRTAGMGSERRQARLGGAPIRQRFMLEPHGRHWLFALDRPETVPRDAYYEAGGALRSYRPVHGTLRYEVTSRPDTREPELLREHLTEALVRPSYVSPEVGALVRGWRAAGPGDRELVATALRWFGKGDFTYTLSPGTYGGTGALDEFLFRRRAGFCEHYAAAFASLMRVAGVPSRVVVGYHGGEFNRLGQYVIVRQSEAHAWSEVWIKGEGWMRVDPTAAIAPERLTMGLDSLLANAGDGAGSAGGFSAGARGLRSILRDLRFAWDNLNYQWDLRVLGFDEENQRELFTDLGLPQGRWIPVAAWGLVLSAPVIGGLWLWLRRPARPRRDPVVSAWGRFCRALAVAGVVRAPNEGPGAFTERAAAAVPARAGEIRRLGAMYIDVRYAPNPAPAREFLSAVRAFGR